MDVLQRTIINDDDDDDEIWQTIIYEAAIMCFIFIKNLVWIHFTPDLYGYMN